MTKKKILTEKEHPELFELMQMWHEDEIKTVEEAISEVIGSMWWSTNEVWSISDYLKHLFSHGMIEDYLTDGKISALSLIDICEGSLVKSSMLMSFLREKGLTEEFLKFQKEKKKIVETRNKKALH